MASKKDKLAGIRPSANRDHTTEKMYHSRKRDEKGSSTAPLKPRKH